MLLGDSYQLLLVLHQRLAQLNGNEGLLLQQRQQLLLPLLSKYKLQTSLQVKHITLTHYFLNKAQPCSHTSTVLIPSHTQETRCSANNGTAQPMAQPAPPFGVLIHR
jgi:hypothetical protein